jgi:predicted RNA binding protein YcfA (HicA-like mRNA interferase family)
LKLAAVSGEETIKVLYKAGFRVISRKEVMFV